MDKQFLSKNPHEDMNKYLSNQVNALQEDFEEHLIHYRRKSILDSILFLLLIISNFIR